jgi:predicted metalloprotease with PDZ domain
MKKHLLFYIFYTIIPLISLFGQQSYEIAVYLDKVVDDRVKVEVIVPQINHKKVEYIMPAVIPGSYSVKDYGRFIVDFKAFTKSGKKLKVKKTSLNVFTIEKAEQLYKIEYWVDDTWDAGADNYIFQPGGTNIQQNKNFVINHQGFYGYLEGYKNLPYSITYYKPPGFYSTTALKTERNDEKDIVFAENYVKLVDNPVMICKADTLSFKISNMRVFISVYSVNNVVQSSLVKQAIEPISRALENFFTTLPVNEYYFIMYFPKYSYSEITSYGGFGALEHSYCSFYFLPESDNEERLISMIRDVAAHEFLHILTPLNIHSEEIENFDFRHPKMSQHLWMYEGVTEYFSHLVQVKSKLIEPEDFFMEMSNKINRAAAYKDVSFTQMSKNILNKVYNEMYSNVYQKGALIGFLLDIKLHEISSGKTGLRELMLEMAQLYGPSKPFKDDSLFNIIAKIAGQDVLPFINDYIIGDKPLPYKEYLNKIGLNYYEEIVKDEYYFAETKFITLGNGDIAVLINKNADNYTGLTTGDIIQKINNQEINSTSKEPLKALSEPLTDQELTIHIKRKNQPLTLTCKPVVKKANYTHYIERKPDATQQQINLLNVMLQL